MKIEIIISIITGVLTIFGTVATVAYGWGKIKQFMLDLKESLGSFRQEIKDELKEMKKDVKEHDRDIVFLKSKNYSVSSSPLQLNDAGNKVLRESKINSIIDERADKLIEKIKQTYPETFYDVQLTAQTILENLIKENHSILVEVKKGAYNSGVDIDIVIFVGSLYLRDKYIEKYPENNGNQ